MELECGIIPSERMLGPLKVFKILCTVCYRGGHRADHRGCKESYLDLASKLIWQSLNVYKAIKCINLYKIVLLRKHTIFYQTLIYKL